MDLSDTIRMARSSKVRRVRVLQGAPASERPKPFKITHKIKFKPMKIWRSLFGF